jgi:hypothetical protein
VLAGYERTTPQDIQAAARRYLTADRAWMLVVRPEGKPGEGATR